MSPSFLRGRRARMFGAALLSNPLTRETTKWDEWRSGWLFQDTQEWASGRPRLPKEEEQAPCPRN